MSTPLTISLYLEIESEVLMGIPLFGAIAINSCSRDKKDSHPAPDSIFLKKGECGSKGDEKSTR